MDLRLALLRPRVRLCELLVQLLVLQRQFLKLRRVRQRRLRPRLVRLRPATALRESRQLHLELLQLPAVLLLGGIVHRAIRRSHLGHLLVLASPHVVDLLHTALVVDLHPPLELQSHLVPEPLLEMRELVLDEAELPPHGVEAAACAGAEGETPGATQGWSWAWAPVAAEVGELGASAAPVSTMFSTTQCMAR
eukprot:scaffold113272_cov66-Phaeocystis_antarctica.AAC.5